MRELIALILSIVVLLCLCSCDASYGSSSDGILSESTGENKEWAPGYIEDDTYINEFAGIKFVKDDAWVFDKKLDANGKGPALDMAADSAAINRVEVAFVQAQSPINAEECLRNMLEITPGWEFGAITERSFCGQKYFCVDGTLSVNRYRCYYRAINNYLVIINIFAVDVDISEIEAMFCKIKA